MPMKPTDCCPFAYGQHCLPRMPWVHASDTSIIESIIKACCLLLTVHLIQTALLSVRKRGQWAALLYLCIVSLQLPCQDIPGPIREHMTASAHAPDKLHCQIESLGII